LIFIVELCHSENANKERNWNKLHALRFYQFVKHFFFYYTKIQIKAITFDTTENIPFTNAFEINLIGCSVLPQGVDGS